VQKPAFDKVGILDLESFFPEKDRFALALKLNGILAAPGFDQWFEGEALDPAALLRTSSGKPRVSIFSIAHLDETERMFFVSLLLTQVLGWMRAQTGTSSLRAILYMDEIAGYFPPVSNPPSKAPLLTMLKQARAFGVGVLLATQNPVDLDYKGLANTGTWLLGRLQTERDKARLLDGLEGAAGGSLDRAEADRILSSLDKRVFLLHNVHEARPVTFQTRWTMSYLRGPLSRPQIQLLMKDARAVPAATAAAAPAVTAPAVAAAAPRRAASGPPVLPPGIEQYFLPSASAAPSPLTPVVVGAARVSFSDSKLGVETSRDVVYAAPLSDGAVALDWQEAAAVECSPAALQQIAPTGAAFSELPSAAQQKRNYEAWTKAFAQWLSQTQRVELLRHRATKLTSRADESERDFRARVQDALREARDAEKEAVQKKFAARRETIASRVRRAEDAVSREQQQASQQKTQTLLSVGAAAIGALFGRKTFSTGTLGRATTAARGVGRSMKESEDIQRAQKRLTDEQTRLQEFDEQLEEELSAVASRFESAIELDRVALAPKRGQVQVLFVGLGWR
jgi:hypothetical protein